MISYEEVYHRAVETGGPVAIVAESAMIALRRAVALRPAARRRAVLVENGRAESAAAAMHRLATFAMAHFRCVRALLRCYALERAATRPQSPFPHCPAYAA